jgi:autotransporter-associated beta strand protein
VIGALLFFLLSQTSYAIDWNTIPVIEHSDYQAINETSEGSGNWVSNFSGTLPFRLIGVVLNDSVDYLDAMADYTSTFTPYYLGGQAQIYIQAVNLDGTQWDPDTNTAYSDSGGTACWMGQNYGNLPWIRSTKENYTNAAWYAELDRLQIYYTGSTASYTLHAGDLVEIRTSVGGLYYNGMMNVNEQHSTDSANDFEIVVLKSNYGLPTTTALALSDLKHADDTFIFNSAAPRDSGAEHYQSTLVKLTGVRLTNPLLWGPNMDLQLTDDTGRTIGIHLGLNAGFYSFMAPVGSYDVTGIIDQESANGQDGYRLLTLKADYFSTISSVAAPVWNGGGGSDTRWSTTANWSGPSLSSNWELHFDGSTNLNSVNDQNITSFYGIVFNPDAAAFTLSGNSIKVKRVANFSSVTQTVDLSLNTDDANCLFLAEPGNILVSEPIVGANGIEKYGSADLTLTAVNTYAGTTDIEAGLLKLSNGGNIDASSEILVASGATLRINGGEHHLAAISGKGDTILADSAQVTADSIVQDTLTIGAGCTLTIAAISGGPISGAEAVYPTPEPSAMLILLLGFSGFATYGVIRIKN